MMITEKHKSLIERLVNQTIKLIQTEYPNGIRLSLTEPSEKVITPKGIYPAFYGCYDWHSAVHSHWQIARAMHLLPDGNFVADGMNSLATSLTAENIAVEMEWINARRNFEMPYGMAWLLTLCSELKTWGTAEALKWHKALRPMETHAIERFIHYCQNMPMPNRGGLHNQSAFSLGLVWDYAKQEGNQELQDLVASAARRFFWTDTYINLSYEPSAADFLSPSLSEADLMRRVLEQGEFEVWLELFVPEGFAALKPVQVVDPSNGQLAHWAGLNLSRSWMLTNIGNAMPETYWLRESLLQSGQEHLTAGMPMATHPDYMISHWVPTFAIYLLTMNG